MVKFFDRVTIFVDKYLFWILIVIMLLPWILSFIPAVGPFLFLPFYIAELPLFIIIFVIYAIGPPKEIKTNAHVKKTK